MARRLISIVMFAMAVAGAAEPATARPPADSASLLAGVRSKLVQLRTELQMNQAALASHGLSANDRAKLNARAQQISSEIESLLVEEKNLAQK